MKKIFTYLEELEKNNDRDWYHAHKAERLAAQAEFERLLEQLILEIAKFDPVILRLEQDVKSLTFKLQRDTRFSHDKSPYNPAFRAHLGPAGKPPVPVGYYVVLRPAGSFLGGGLFADMFKDATARVRGAIAQKGSEFEAIIAASAFRFEVKGEKLKKVPAGFDSAHPQAEYLKYKNWYLEDLLPKAALQSGDEFLKTAPDVFRRMKPFNDFLNEALQGFEMPTR